MKKGRSKTLLEKRNRKLIERYFYYTEIERVRFDDVLHALSNEEFFISETCVLSIIKKYGAYYKKLKLENKPKAAFKLFK